MKQSVVLVAILGLIAMASPTFADDGPPATMPTPVLDVVTLKDGSVIYGEVVEMSGGLLQVKNALASDIIRVKGDEVSKLAVSHSIPFHSRDGTVLVGTDEEGEPGTMVLKAARAEAR